MSIQKFSLIVPIAGDSPEYEYKIPLAFSQDETGTMLCVRAIMGLPLQIFNDIYFVIIKKHDLRYNLRDRLAIQFKQKSLNNAKVLVLDDPTDNQPQTVYEAIKTEGIDGCIFVKDADGYFIAEEILQQNGIAIYPLEELSIVDPQHKSYVAVDDMNYITNIIEHRVVSNYFNAGGYCFEDAEEFCRYYERIKDYGSIYLSHIIYSMLLDEITFRPIEVSDYFDYSLK